MPLDHERLIVYQRGIEFVSWANDFLEDSGLKGEIKSPLDRASISVPLNIAEGNGKFSIRDRVRFLDIAYGSALECAACLDIARAKRAVSPDQIANGKAIIEEIVNRLIRLRQSLNSRLEEAESDPRVREASENDYPCLYDLENRY